MKAVLLLFLLCVVRADDPCCGIKELLQEQKSSLEERLSTMEERLSTMVEGHLKSSLGGQDSGHSTSNNLTLDDDPLKTTWHTLKTTYDALKTNNDVLMREKTQLKTTCDAQKTNYETLMREKTQLKTNYDALTQEKTQLKTNYDTLMREKTQLTTNYDALTQEKTQLKTNYDALMREKTQLTTNYDALTQEKTQLKTNYDALMQEKNQLQSEVEQLKRQAADKSCPSGWKKFADKCYYRTTAGTWQQGRDYCQTQGADLLVVNSREEQVFIRGLRTGGFNGSWMGLIRTEGSWAWLDGSPLTTTYWYPGHPINNEDMNCAYYFHYTDPGTWANDDPCSSARPAICEK